MEDRADIEILLEIFFKAWSVDSSSKWTKENPASGQCGVTSLVAHDLLGGEILKTQVGKAWHFYDRIDHRRIDFTESQFIILPDYEDRLSSREEAFTDTNQMQYYYLKTRTEELWNKYKRVK